MGGELTFTVSVKKDGKWMQYKDFKVRVSEYKLEDYGLTYRKIAPGYETYSHIGNYQRDIHSWDETAIIESQSIPGQCMSCHTANRANPAQFTFLLRGKHGATLVQREVAEDDPAANGRANGKPIAREWLKSDHDSTLSKCVYPYWHPSGNYCACSLNLIHQLFWTGKERLIEVFDDASDVIVLDVRTKEKLRSPLIERTKDVYETYPAFSVDGKWLLYYWSDFGNFPIDHKESDLWMLNLSTGKRHALEAVNSDCTESYHNWSSDSHCVVFASRREDGLYSLLYLTCIDDDGNASKPFLLPQKNPWQYYHNSIYSYNVPDFTCDKVDFDVHGAYEESFGDKKIPVTIR